MFKTKILKMHKYIDRCIWVAEFVLPSHGPFFSLVHSHFFANVWTITLAYIKGNLREVSLLFPPATEQLKVSYI